MDRWPLAVADFQKQFGIDLEDVYRRKSWKWFEVRVLALLSIPDSLLGRSADEPEPTKPPEPRLPGEDLAA